MMKENNLVLSLRRKSIDSRPLFLPLNELKITRIRREELQILKNKSSRFKPT